MIATYVVLEPSPSTLSYASVLGWAGMVGAIVLLVQGFRIVGTRSQRRNNLGQVGYAAALNRWGGIHTALAIAVTVLVAIHGLLFVGGLFEFSAAIWIGAVAFVVLVVLNLSGVVTESKRKSRRFGSLKTVHVILMLAVVGLSAIHIEVLLGPSFARTVLGGAIVTAVVVFVVFVSVPLLPRTGSLP